jgi:murein DD-endopeptidase MepM/ murein hydrolase activator NlpD
MKIFPGILTLLLFFFILVTTANADPPRPEPVPGGIAIVPLVSGSDTYPVVHYQGNRVLVSRSGSGWKAVVGIPLGAKPGRHILEVDGKEVGFEVGEKTYAEQRLTVPNRRHVHPDPEDLRRIEKDSALSRSAYRTFTPQAAEFGFLIPVEGRMSSPFGLRRFFNGEERNPHSGLDIAAPTGTPIRAPAPGVVVAAADMFFNGNAVFIDHGQGLVTMFCHLDSINVQEGQRVERGETIGTVGATGRATGPHLHWSVSLNDARVDPLLFLNDDIVTALKGSAQGR